MGNYWRGRNSPIKVWSAFGKEVQDTTHELVSEHWANFTFSPDSKLMAAGCKGETIKVWNVADFSSKTALPGASYAVAFSLDGRELLTASLKELPRWWNLEAKAWRPAPPYHGGSLTNRVVCVDFSPDRTMAALGFKNGFIEIVEVASAKQMAWWKAHNDEVRSVAFSPNGSLLVSGARDHSVAEWDVNTQRGLGSNAEHRGAICAVTFSKDGKLIATGCGAGTIKIWSPNSPLTNSLSTIAYHQAGIRSLAFSPDGRTLASGSDDHTVKLWNLKLRQQVASFRLDRPVELVVFSPDGQTLGTVTEGGTLKLFRAANKTEADGQEE